MMSEFLTQVSKEFLSLQNKNSNFFLVYSECERTRYVRYARARHFFEQFEKTRVSHHVNARDIEFLMYILRF